MRRLKNVTLCTVEGTDLKRIQRALDVCTHYCRFDDVVVLSPLSADDFRYNDRLRKTGPIDYEVYNRFMVKELVHHVTTDFCLVIQHDGFILNPDAWTDEFYQYDCIGAPWGYYQGANVGNGGFSLRSRKLLHATSAIINEPVYAPEDTLIGRRYRQRLEATGLRFAPRALAERFSFEGNWPCYYRWNGQFGYHNHDSDISLWKPPF